MMSGPVLGLLAGLVLPLTSAQVRRLAGAFPGCFFRASQSNRDPAADWWCLCAVGDVAGGRALGDVTDGRAPCEPSLLSPRILAVTSWPCAGSVRRAHERVVLVLRLRVLRLHI